MNVLGHYNYVIVVLVMMTGFYVLISQGNLIKKIVGLNVFQTAVIFFYVSTAKIIGGTAPVLVDMSGHDPPTGIVYSNPLPHVLMLTAIVVGVATMALGFALVVRIKEAYGTIEDDEIARMDLES